MSGKLRDILISFAALTAIAGATALALAGTNALTEAAIRGKSDAAGDAARREVIGADAFTERVLTVADGDVIYFEAMKNGRITGYVFTAQTVGRSAGLVVMTGISSDGKITGVAVAEDNETAGYVDKLRHDGGQGSMLGRFAGKSAGEALKLGVNIDGVSQATKTSQGVVDGVNQALEWYRIVAEKGGAS